MDTITDILSTFFVSSKPKRNKRLHNEEKSHSKNEQVSKKEKSSPENDNDNDNSEKEKCSSEKEKCSSEKEKCSSEKEKCSEQCESESYSTFTSEELQTFTDKTDPMKIEKVKRYIIKSTGMCRKNIAIINTDVDDNFKVLSDVLHSFSIMNNVQDVYYNTINIITSENKRKCKKMFLDNPYMYFTDFSVSHSIPSTKIKSIIENEKKVIVIIDMDNLRDNFEKYIDLVQSNAQVILLSSSYSEEIVDAYKKLGENRIILHKKQKLKLLQKNFFNKLLKRVCETVETMTFETYYEIMNEENFGIKYVIVLKSELRYY
jgi:hypothetical protein